MKLLLDDKQLRGYDLNANEACIFAAILKCTKAGRGWFGNYRDLAAALPFAISASTVYRAVEKLFNLGLIERRDNTLFALLQNETSLLQNETNTLQNETTLLQNETENVSPYNSLIINNENMKENEHATCAQACDTRKIPIPDFSVLKSIFIFKSKKAVMTAELDNALAEWEKCSPVKKIKLLEAVKSGAHFKPRLDWLITDFPEPQPYFLSGVEQDNCHVACIPLVQVKYNGKFLICTRATMELFGLEWVRDW